MIDQELLRDLTESYLKRLIAEASGSLNADFDSSAAFGELGIDSFQVLKIIRNLEADFGTLPKSLLFERFNIEDLASYFVEKHEQTLAAKFAEQVQNVVPTPTSGRAARSAVARDGAGAAAPGRAGATAGRATPIRILEKDAFVHPELKELVQTLFARHKIEGSVSRGTRKIAPNLFIGSARLGYFNYSRSKNLVLVYGYTGPRDHFPALLEEMVGYCSAKGFQINVLADEEIPPAGGTSFSATPFGALQRIVNLKEFTLDGGPMRRLRYQVSKFQKSGACKTEEYRCGSKHETDAEIAVIIDRWCASRTMVNPLIHDVRSEILAGTLPSEHRLFLTYLDDRLQNVILITEMSSAETGYLMDLEFYLPEMPLGGLEFAIAQIIDVLIAEGCDVLSLGGTYGCKLEPSASADPEIDKILDDLREQNIFNDAGNLQFKNKFRPDNRSIFLCRPVGSGNPANVIDIIMMIADPDKMQTSEAENQGYGTARFDDAAPVDAPSAHRPAPVEEKQAGGSRLAIEGDDRSRILSDYAFNPLNIAHEHVEFDLKTDSWAQLEMPAIAAQMRQLHGQMQQPANVDDGLRSIFPFAHFVLTASGQAAEHIFFKAWPKKGVVLQNLLFPSTIFHQIDKGFTPVEIPHAEVFRLSSRESYKGDLAWDALQAKVAENPAAVAMVCIEVTNNAAGGSAVSIQHLRQVQALLAEHSIPLVIDATRVVENAQFLIEQETQYSGKSVWTVVREMLSCADAVIGSLTKDFCVNRGGFIATNDAALFEKLQELLHEEGGGIDLIEKKMIALSLRNRKQIEARVLRRMEHVRLISQALHAHGVPIASSSGGHCVLIDVKQVPEFKDFSDPVASFVAWLYVNTGIRGGAHSVGMQKRTPINDLVRLAIPVGLKRDDIDDIVARLIQAFARKVNIPEVVMESRTPQPFVGVHASYKLVRYHNVSGNVVDLHSSPASAEMHGASSETTATKDIFRQTDVPRSVANDETRKTEDVAIVGMAGRYPGAKNLGELWDNLTRGRDCIEEMPAARYERRLQHGSSARYRGGFIDDVDKFDSLFFNISPREAEMLDPQERLFLEVAWEALEDAGYYPEILAQEDASRNIGVYVGAVWTMYQMLGVEEKHAGNKIVPNSFLWSIANRVSYAFNLSGPSLTVDTACSSSLTALHLACEAIQTGGCSAAIVGGVNLDLHQAKFDINHQGGALSADGVCRAFGKGANGYVMGEGIGALLLKPLGQAVQDGDNIYGVIKSSVVNHGGRTSGYTVPNPRAQADLIVSAIEKADIDARSIGYVEAHGTGTELGDPIEITGLNDAFQSSKVENRSCAIGSVKTNIGHLEAAAGVVSVSKVLLQMRHRQLVPSLHSSELNEFIDFEHSSFYVVRSLEEWNAKEVDGVRLPLRAGISSFGAGGSNAHVILESYDPIRHVDVEPDRARRLIFPLSARTEDQLRQAAVRLAAFLEGGPIELSDAAYTLQCGRKSFEHRLVVLARTREELVENLACFIDGRKGQDVVTGQAKGGEAVTRLLNRRQKQEFIQLVSQGADPHKIAGLWAEGLLSDWQGFQSSGERISLPTYPFADKRHWAFEASAVSRGVVRTAGMHPMVDSNESTFERQLFKKTFTERDFFLYDHHVSDIPTLPGVAYLELARKAGELAAGRKVQRIRNILWISPIALQGTASKEVFIELKPSGDTVQFEVFSQDAGGVKMPHSQGKLLYATKQETAAEPEYLDLEGVRARTAKVIEGATVYPLFKAFGLNLGPSFQVLQDVYKNELETLGAMTLPKFREGDLQSMVLLPSLVDGSLQAGMAAQLGGQVGEMFVPFSIGEVEILHPLQSNCFSYVTEVKDDHKRETSRVLKSNVLIVDETGKILVKIHDSIGVPLREIHKKPAPNADGDGFSRLYYSYDWQRATLAEDAKRNAPRSVVLFDTEETLRDLVQERLRAAGTSADHVILVRPGETFQDLGGQSYTVSPRSKDDFTQLFRTLVDKSVPVENICFAWPSGGQDLQESLEKGVYSLLFVCQSLIELKLENAVQLLSLSSGTEEDWQPHDAAMTGFINTLHLEHPKLICKTVEVRQENAGREQMIEAMWAELSARTQDATAVRYDVQQRRIKKLQAFDLAEVSDASDAVALKVRENGVYLITGGAGGLGLIFAEFLATQYKARLVLTGRSAPSAELEARLEELRTSGAEVLYLAADVSSHHDVGRVVDECRSRHGALHGIIHAAGVLRDSLIRNKTPEEMRAVFAPKVHGTVHLDELTKDQDLDFFVTFSSLAAVAGNAGQSDYSFANHFMDSFAAKRELLRAKGARSGKTLSVNWSLWADGGMKLDEQTELFFKKTLGISPLSAATGLDAFMRGLASPRSQFAVLEGVQEKVELAWGLRKKPAAPAPVAAPASTGQAVKAPVGDLTARLQEDLTQLVMELLKVDAADVPSDQILLDLGFDSIGLTTFANAVNEKYQLDITPVLFFDYPTLGEIAKHLCAERKTEIDQFYRGAAGAPTMAAAPPAAQHHAEIGAAESHQAARLEIRKGWDPAALDRQGPAAAPSGMDISPELRFVNDPIAIVGMSGVMPQSEDLNEFWDNLASSKDMISVIPADRWRWEDFYGDPLKEINKSNSKWGGFMTEVDKFDPLFFGISPREAQMMDPQQRLFLEHAWKAIEDSGQKVSDLSGTKTGVFVGVATNDYTDVLRGQEIALDGYSASGNSHSVLANRVSFLLNLRGPSAPIDTACSSSLVAMHRAIESIHTGSSDMAIVGGVHVMLSPAAYISFGMAGMLSGDGKCKTFDKRANGYVRGEGCGAIFIKRLSAAKADGNHIYAVIKATAENHGGRVTTMTAPNSAAQTDLIVEAYEKAHVDPSTVGFIECHGTGTPLGDPIEIQALSKAFSELYKKNDTAPAVAPHCGLSSVKTNIGHLETAAGIAGVLKAVLAIRHKQIPANIHLEEVNPYINLKGTPFYIADRLTPWQAPVGADGSPAPRRAGVSSFGFGGANVHVVLEEYLSGGQASPDAYGPQLVVLSAKNEDRVAAYARSMLAALDRDDVDLRDLAYTLQVGRDEMQERLALVASSTADLKQKLEEILRGERPNESFRGNIKSKDAKSAAADGAEGETLVRDLIGRKELSWLAELWVRGAKIEWRGLHDSGHPRRISLPTYPFARERHWIAIKAKTVSTEQRPELTAAALLHPLIHRNVSTLEEQKFSSHFSGREFYLADHVVETHRMLPGVAYLEMARAAGELSGNAKVRVIRNLTWERPLVVDDDGSDVQISLAPFKDEVKFTVTTTGGQGAITHCTGRLGYQLDGSQPEVLDIARIRERCSEQVLSGKELYPFLSDAGLKLGPSFQIVQSISANESESLAILQLPEHLRQDADLFWLHPALMDGSLHTAIGLAKTNGMDVSSNLPYSVGEVQILHPLRDLHYGYATWAADGPKAGQNVLKVTFHLLDKNGKVLVRIKDFVSRPFHRGPVAAAAGAAQEQSKAAAAREAVPAGLQSLVPVWNAVRVAPGARVVITETSNLLVCGAASGALDWVRKVCPGAERLEFEANASVETMAEQIGDRTVEQLLWIAPDVCVSAGSDELLVEKQEAGVIAHFRLVKALLQRGYAARKLQWTVIISGTQRIPGGGPMRPAHSGIVGLVGSLAKEHPLWDLRLLDIESLDAVRESLDAAPESSNSARESLNAVPARECLSLPWDKQGNVLVHHDGEWFQQSLAVMPAQPQTEPLDRHDGVYVVIGGAGGVGEVWSRYMIENHQANVVWIGRRERDASIDAKIDSLSQIGPAPLYVTADATDVAALEQARRTILESFPAINGVVHSAIVLRDQPLARMDEATFRASLSAKVDVAVNMDRVFGPDALDFMLFFSSIVSFVKSPGQSNYSAGCTFKDSLAHRLQQRRAYPVKIMNWGYWGNVGVVADESYNRNMALMGIGSIDPDEGMAALQALVASGIPQLALLKTLNSQAGAGFNLSETAVQYPRTAPPVLAHVQPSLAEQFADAPTAHLDAELPTAEMADFATEIVASSLMSLGLFRNGIRTLHELSLEKQPPPYYERWLSSSIDYLQQQHILTADLTFQREIRALPELWSEWEVKRSVWGTAPNVQAQIALVETCLKALPAVLSGRQRATDVLFPKSSMQLVEGIYRDNVLADHFNDVLGRTLTACIEQRLRAADASEIRILEIGAGTGGTTAKLLPLLQQYPIAEYCYTDLSRAFLMYAETNYRPQFPALTTAIFDVTKPLASQSIEAGRFDFAIAANVLHATPDIRETLRNTKAALKNGGVLLLNEMSSWSFFNHLTFGLLEGWWLHEDTALRIPGSPGLSPRKWQDVLSEEGFESVVFPAQKTHAFGQQIVGAESNGWVRQRIVRELMKAAPQQLTAEGSPAQGRATHIPAARDERPVLQPSSSRESNEQMSIDYIKQIITRQLSEALKLDAVMIRGDAPFSDFGVDSIVGVNFVRTVSEELQIELETTSLFEYSTVDDLSRYIATNWKQQMAEQSGSLRNESQGSVPPVQSVPKPVPDMHADFPVRIESRFAKRGSFAEPEAGEDDRVRESSIERIAIIGMSGRFAESESLEAFWRNLTEGRDLVKEVSRWPAADCVMSESSARTYCSQGSFVDSIDQFDPAFFGISAEEAVVMDPQQRLFLEESWKALEDAGYAGKSVNEKQCGVYVGCGSSNYDRLFTKEPPPQAFWGNSDAVVPARIAYHLNLRGPAISIDTACSSSLVAIHLACQGLWAGETEMALAGGVFLQVTPGFHQVANRAGMLSPDGECRSFDASANGFVPGDGVGVVVLKRLRDALADGDHVHGVIAGSGINQDGSSNGLIAPNGRAQERLERSVYDRFKINPESIQVVEAHGTGTLLGDSIEYAAISRAFREYTDRKQFCALGTVKTNIGHAATAAGVAGVLKLLLSLKHRQIPPSLHFQKGNPAMDLESGPFYVNTQLTEWQVGENEPRRAAISSFGFSGTNAHLIIEEAPPVARPASQAPGFVVSVSARTQEQLQERVRALLALATGTPDLSMNDLSFTLFVGRMHFPHRVACLARNREELILGLERWMQGGTPSNVYVSEVHEGRTRERVALTKFGNYCIEECRNATDAAGYLENLAAVADLYAQGYALDYSSLFPRGSRRIPLPTYPFARERYWVETAGGAAPASPATDPSVRLHPLLHANTSTLGQQSYRSTLTGTELPLRDHVVAMNGHGAQSVLPAAAYLEMARAAVENAVRVSGAPSLVELEETVWGSPMVVAGRTEVTIDLFADEDGGIHYEISSGDVVHCQGRAFVSDRPAPAHVNVDVLLQQMQQRVQDADGVYAAFAQMGLHHGPAHRAISAVHYGDGQLVARLSIPSVATASDVDGYSLHPSLMTGALQAGLSLIAELGGRPRIPALPHSLGRMHILSSCEGEMFAWVRRAADDSLDGDRIALDIDLIDRDGRVCVQMRGVAFSMDTTGSGPAAEGAWLFLTEADAAAETGAIHMGAVETIALFLRQETALQLQRPLDDIRTDQSYFDLGLSSLAMAHLVQTTNRLLGENLLPSALFDFRDIDGLASYLAAMYPAKIDALTVSKRTVAAIPSAERRHIPTVNLKPFPRKSFLPIRPAAPSQQERPIVTASAPELSREQVLEKILWQEAALDDDYEKVAF